MALFDLSAIIIRYANGMQQYLQKTQNNCFIYLIFNYLPRNISNKITVNSKINWYAIDFNCTLAS